MEKKVLEYIEVNRMLQRGDSVVLGVSGGADSMCMLMMLNNISRVMELQLTVVHVNHHLRGEEADDDQKYVEDFCKKINVPCEVHHIDMVKLAEEMKCSEEEAGRIARYDIFEQVCNHKGANKIAVAHNLNDSSETVMFNMFRGTGIKGLCGIRPVRGNIIRPILCLTRSEIERYLSDNSILFRTDSTNVTEDYTRNKIRNKVVPYVEEYINTNAMLNVARASEDMAEIEEYLGLQAKEIMQDCVSEIKNGYLLKDELSQHHIVIRKIVVRNVIEILSGKLKDITRTHIGCVLQLYGRSTGSQVSLPYGIIAKRTYQGIMIQRIDGMKTEKDESFIESIIFDNGSCISTDDIDISLEEYTKFHENIKDLVYTKWIDCDKIKGALVVRKRQQGDYLTIDNQGNTKKLKDYFINEKIPRDERDKVLLVADGNHIVWIIGYRISSEYKVTSSTTTVLKLSYKGSDR